MIKPEQIPDEVVEAAAKAEYEYMETHESWRGSQRAAIAAALNAWPDAERIYRSEDEKLFTVMLPIPQEGGDA